MTGKETFQKLLAQITSGRFICTVVVILVYAFLACKGVLKEDRVMEITLVVLYAYFNKSRHPESNGETETTTTKTTTLITK